MPLPVLPEEAPPAGAGSIIVIVATDAPLMPTQLQRLAQRAGLGIAWLGAWAGNYSGDLFLAFSTAAHDLPPMNYGSGGPLRVPLEMLSLCYLDPLLEAVVEATAEAILNAMLQAETMTGRDGVTAHALDERAPRRGARPLRTAPFAGLKGPFYGLRGPSILYVSAGVRRHPLGRTT